MTKNLPEFEPDDVLSFYGFSIRACELQAEIEAIANDYNTSSNLHNALRDQLVLVDDKYEGKWTEGIDCEALKLSDPTWRSGKLKLRLCLDFIPDESADAIAVPLSGNSESPLDEIRNMLSNS